MVIGTFRLSYPSQRNEPSQPPGYTRLEQLTNVSETDLHQLHGVGPKALEQLRRALAACGLSFARRS